MKKDTKLHTTSSDSNEMTDNPEAGRTKSPVDGSAETLVNETPAVAAEGASRETAPSDSPASEKTADNGAAETEADVDAAEFAKSVPVMEQDEQAVVQTDSQSGETETGTGAANTGKQPPPRRKSRTRRGGPGRNRRLWVALVVLLVFIVGLSGLVYWGWQQYQTLLSTTVQVQSDQASLRQQVSSLSRSLNDSVSAREQLARQTSQQQADLEAMLIETAQRLSRRQDLDADRWPLEEALTLLRLAERRLQLDRDATIAISLMNAADQVLAGLTQAAVLPVRRQIAADRLALQSVSSADVNGAYFRLEAIAERIAGSLWVPAARLEPQEQAITELSWAAFRDSLSSLVTVSRLDVPFEAPPLLSDFAQWQQHSQLLTEQVQLALLAQNQPLYDAALEQLHLRISAMSTELGLEAMVNDLDTLQGLNLEPDYPDVHGSVESLERYMTRVETEASDAAGDGEGDS
jgi:uroporphyrin-3 C-methyltransferase